MENIFLAIFFAVIANSLLYIGLVFEKKGASELPKIEETKASQNIMNFIKNPRWFWGFIMTNIQLLFYWLALSYGPISLVSPVLGVGLVVLIIFSRYYLGESINRVMYFGIIIIILGIIALGITTQEVSDTAYNTYDKLLVILATPNSIIIIIVLVLATIVPTIVCVGLKYKYADILCGIGSGFANAIGSLFSKFMVQGFDMGQWEFYLFLILLIAGNAASMVIQQIGFQKGKAIVLTPIYTVASLIVPALVGVALFNEWSGDSSLYIYINVISMIAVTIGVGLVSFFNAKQENELLMKNITPESEKNLNQLEN
jgi:drug/metabolite transporter (DMT)-like permease